MPPTSSREVLDDGRGEPVTNRLGSWLRARPALLAAVVTLVTAVTTAVAVAAVPLVRGPGVPQLAVTADEGQAGPVVAPWVAGADGRPEGPVVLAVSVTVRADPPADGAAETGGTADVSIVGVTGPGVVRAENPAVPLPPGGGPVAVPLRSVVDCTKVPALLPAGTFRLAIRVKDGDRTRRVDVDAGVAGQGWATTIATACASWTARREVTVTTVTARVDPVLPRLDLTLGVTNTGESEVTLQPAAQGDLRLRSPEGRPLRVPPHATVTGRATVTLDRCDEAAGLAGSDASRRPLDTSLIGLTAIAGPVPLQAPVDPTPYGPFDGIGSTGVVLTPEAGDTLATALRQACGDLGPIVALIGPEGVRYDRAGSEVTVPLILDVTPGRVRSLTLRGSAGSPPGGATDVAVGSDALVPLWTATPDLVPDRTGQVRTVLRYRAPAAASCPRLGHFLPEIVADLRVPTATGERRLTLSTYLALDEDSRAAGEPCGERPPGG